MKVTHKRCNEQIIYERNIYKASPNIAQKL